MQIIDNVVVLDVISEMTKVAGIGDGLAFTHQALARGSLILGYYTCTLKIYF